MNRRPQGYLIFGFGVCVLLIGLSMNASIIFDMLAPPALVYDSPLRVLNNPVTAGTAVVLEVSRSAWNITGTDPVQAEVSRQLVRVDRQGAVLQPREVIVLDSVTLGVPEGHSVVQSRLSMIPADVPGGTWRIEGMAYARHRSASFYTEVIEVVGP